MIACAAAAAVALYASSRAWVVDVTPRPAPLPPTTSATPGSSVAPAVPALALVGLAGAGALLATRGMGRLAVGIVLVLSGLGLVIACAYALARVDAVGARWPVVAALAGAVVAIVGAVALRRGTAWPALGARYDRSAPVGRTLWHGPEPLDETHLWDAIDRGEDPTTQR